MHKANARANEYFWDRYAAQTGRASEKEKLRARRPAGAGTPARYLYILTSDAATPHCHYRNLRRSDATIDDSMLSRSLTFCHENDYLPVFLGAPDVGTDSAAALSIVAADAKTECGGSIPVFDNATSGAAREGENAILLLDRAHIGDLSDYFRELTRTYLRINIVLEELEAWTDEDLALYETEIRRVAETTKQRHMERSPVEVNVLTDLWYLTEMCNCGAGENNFTVAPNGKIYLCPAFYFNDPEDSVGSLEAGMRVANPELLEAGKSPYCGVCDVYSCQRCKFLNKTLTGEVAIPSRIQCLVSHLERKVSMELQHALVEQGLLRPANALGPVWYSEPLELVVSHNGSRR